LFLFWKSESKVQSVVQVAYDYVDVMSEFAYRKQKRIEFAKCCQNEIKYLFKNIATN